jgi:hypothetical protein
MTTVRKPRRKATTPLFGELAELEDDPWWNSLLVKISNGFFPHRVNYSNSTLFFRNRQGKYFPLILDANFSPRELLDKIKIFFRQIVGLIPDVEFDLLDEISHTQEKIDWNILQKNEAIRELLIYLYLQGLHLDDESTNELGAQIWWGFLVGNWTEKTFEIENNRIISFDVDQLKTVKAKRSTKSKSAPKKKPTRKKNVNTGLQTLSKINAIKVK